MRFHGIIVHDVNLKAGQLIEVVSDGRGYTRINPTGGFEQVPPMYVSTPKKLSVEDSAELIAAAFKSFGEAMEDMAKQIKEAHWRLGIGGPKHLFCDECIQGHHNLCKNDEQSPPLCSCDHPTTSDAAMSWAAAQARKANPDG